MWLIVCLAYSEVNMPLLYGEGTKAFLRLQTEIIRLSNDQSIFAWGPPGTRGSSDGMRARSPKSFQLGHFIGHGDRELTYTATQRGLELRVPRRSWISDPEGSEENKYPAWCEFCLDCNVSGLNRVKHDQRPCILLKRVEEREDDGRRVSGWIRWKLALRYRDVIQDRRSSPRDSEAINILVRRW